MFYRLGGHKELIENLGNLGEDIIFPKILIIHVTNVDLKIIDSRENNEFI